MFIAALFTIARIWKQPRCPLADEWIRKLWYIYTMEYYSAIKKNAMSIGRVSFNSSFLGVYTQQWDYWVVCQFISSF